MREGFRLRFCKWTVQIEITINMEYDTLKGRKQSVFMWLMLCVLLEFNSLTCFQPHYSSLVLLIHFPFTKLLSYFIHFQRRHKNRTDKNFISKLYKYHLKEC